MDYVKLYNKVCENYSNQIDFINSCENQLEEIIKRLGTNDGSQLMKVSQQLRDTIERIKTMQIMMLKELYELEALVEVVKDVE